MSIAVTIAPVAVSVTVAVTVVTVPARMAVITLAPLCTYVPTISHMRSAVTKLQHRVRELQLQALPVDGTSRACYFILLLYY